MENNVYIRQAEALGKLLTAEMINRLIDNDFGALREIAEGMAEATTPRPGRLVDAWRASHD